MVLTQFFHACNKDTDEDLLGKWHVMKVDKGDIIYDLKGLDYILAFENDSVVSLKLDVNNCNSIYKIKNENEIAFQAFGCTKVCCDNNLASILIQALNKAERLEIKGENMKLTGENSIYLYRI